MAKDSEKSFPFDAEEVGGKFDREYFAEDWMRYFRAFITSGALLNEPTNLQVIANGDMTVTLKTGSMMIDGARYDNVADIVITLDPADGVLNRIDRIAITWSKPDRDIHYEVRKGEYSYNPVPAECRRTVEYKDYIVADIFVAAGAIKINQTDITDQRLNSEVCGLSVPFTSINTTEFFLQLKSFYDQTVAEHGEWEENQRAEFEAFQTEWMGKETALHEKHKKDLEDYFAYVQETGNFNLNAITQQLIEFRNINESEFLEWFEEIKGIFETDPGGKLAIEIENLRGQVVEMESMLFAGMIRAELSTREGDTIIDSMGNSIMVRRPICKCAN